MRWMELIWDCIKNKKNTRKNKRSRKRNWAHAKCCLSERNKQ